MRDYGFLLIDSNIRRRNRLQQTLYSGGAEKIYTAADAAEAQQIMKQSEPAVQIVITAAQLPGLDGIELCRQIKTSPAAAAITVIVAAAAAVSQQEQAFAAGAADCWVGSSQQSFILARVQSIVRIKTEISQIREREKQAERYNRDLVDDLHVAQQLQLHMLPSTLNDPDIIISGCYLPITMLGGDLYYWDKISEGKYGVILLDVMGHGTATSMVGAYLRSLLPKLISSMETAAECIDRLNTLMVEFNQQLSYKEYHCTAFYMIIDTQERTLEYVTAGNPPAALIEGKQDIRWLQEGCPPLGVFPGMKVCGEKIFYGEKTRILIYSDGIYELLKDKSLNMEYLLNYLRIYGKSEGQAGTVIEKFVKFIKLLPRNDDVSLVCVELST